MKLSRIITQLIVSIVACSACVVHAQAPWTWNLTHTGTYNLNAVVFAAGKFVAVGAGGGSYGLVLTSPDGIEWTRSFVFGTGEMWDVCYDLDRFVIVGSIGTAYSLDGGATWVRSSTERNLRCVTFGGDPGTFVGAGTGAKVSTSTDGLNWPGYVTIPGPTGSRPFIASAFLGGHFYIINDHGDTYRSADGMSFTPNNFGSTIWAGGQSGAGIAYGNERFVAVRNNLALVSTNGTNPINDLSGGVYGVGSPSELRGITFAAGTFVTVGYYGFIASSPTGTSDWTPRPQPWTSRHLQGIAYGTNGLLVAVGYDEKIIGLCT